MPHPETILDPLDLAPAAKNGDYPAAKRVLDVDGATIVAFTFAKGQVLTDHHAPHPITVQTISGDVAFRVEGRDYALPTGRVIHVPEGVIHSVYANADSTFLLTLHTGAADAAK